MRHFKNQRGFTGLEVVLVIVALSAIGAAGYFAWSSKQPANPTSYSNPTPKKTVESKPKPKPTNELEVKQLGFKMTLSSGLEDLKYEIDSQGNALFTTTTLENLAVGKKAEGYSDCSAKQIPIGAVEKSSAQNTAAKKIGNTYYAYVGPQSTCSDNGEVTDLQTKQNQLLRQAFETAKEI